MISKKYKEVIKNLEENIDSKRDLEYAKNQIADLTVLYIDELTKVINNFENKVRNFENKVTNIENDVRRLEDEVDLKLLRTAMSKLNSREKNIMEMRFGFITGNEKTQKEVADELGISQSYISRLEKKIINKMKKRRI